MTPRTPRIGIIGMGHVGSTMRELLSPHAQLVTYDQAHDSAYPKEDLAECDFAIVCVNTPSAADGSCDVSRVVDAVHQLPTHRVLIKSTVAPGTTDALAADTGKELCFSPEYVGESTYYNPLCADAASLGFMIFGGPREVTRWFVGAWLPVLGPTTTYFQCPAIDAELIKYAENTYFAAKVTFVTEFARICEAYGADWSTVREGWLLDPRVEPSHTAVFPTAPGFGGKCLPKDTSAIIAAARAAGYSPDFLEQVLKSNAGFRS